MLPFASILLLASHLLAMNLAAAGPLAAAWLIAGGDAGDQRRHALGRRLTVLSLAALVVGGALGGMLLLVPNPGLRAALARFPANAYWFAGLELLFSAGCIAALVAGHRWLRRRPVAAWALAATTAANLLYHFPPLMAVFGQLAADPDWTNVAVVDRPALLRLWLRPEVLALWTHFILASLATAAIAALWPWRPAAMPSEDNADVSETVVRRLAWWALAASLLQIPAGVWLALASEPTARDAMMGGDLVASASFVGGVVMALALLQTLAAIALGDSQAATRRRAGWLLLIVVALMSITLRTSRTSPDGAPPRHSAP